MSASGLWCDSQLRLTVLKCRLSQHGCHHMTVLKCRLSQHGCHHMTVLKCRLSQHGCHHVTVLKCRLSQHGCHHMLLAACNVAGYGSNCVLSLFSALAESPAAWPCRRQMQWWPLSQVRSLNGKHCSSTWAEDSADFLQQHWYPLVGAWSAAACFSAGMLALWMSPLSTFAGLHSLAMA
jgi:hypothetical protein